MENEYYSDDLIAQRVSYSAGTPYFGLHLGTGYKWNVSPYIGAAYEHELDGEANAATYRS